MMVFIVTENVPPRLRGRLALWFVEVRAGAFVGNYGAKVRDMVWRTVEEGRGQGSAVMAYGTDNESGYGIRTCGPNRRVPVDLDGIQVVRFNPPPSEASPTDMGFEKVDLF